jgi:ribosomal protein S18 acetylase RimI-like enzyme
MHFRVMTTDDLPSALKLWRSCDGIGIGDSDSPAHLTAFLHRNPEMSWVALSDGRLVGAVLAGHDGRRGFLYHLATDPRSRRQGIGQTLVQHALASLRAAGIIKCHVFVYRTNAQGREFWDRMGFVRRNDIDVQSLVIADCDGSS